MVKQKKPKPKHIPRWFVPEHTAARIFNSIENSRRKDSNKYKLHDQNNKKIEARLIEIAKARPKFNRARYHRLLWMWGHLKEGVNHKYPVGG